MNRGFTVTWILWVVARYMRFTFPDLRDARLIQP